MPRPATIADGQLAASSQTIVGVNSAGAGLPRVIDVVLANASADRSQTATITVSRGGAAARQVCALDLGPNETASICNFPLAASDVLAGWATDAGLVDYDATRASDGARKASIEHRDCTGARKTHPALLEQLAGLFT